MSSTDPAEKIIKDDQQDLLKITREVVKKLSHDTVKQEFKTLLDLSKFNPNKASPKEIEEAETIYNFRYIANESSELFYTAVAIGNLLLTFGVLLSNRSGPNFTADISTKKVSIKIPGGKNKVVPINYLLHSIAEDARVKEDVAREIWEAFIRVIVEQPDILSNQEFRVVKKSKDVVAISLNY